MKTSGRYSYIGLSEVYSYGVILSLLIKSNILTFEEWNFHSFQCREFLTVVIKHAPNSALKVQEQPYIGLQIPMKLISDYKGYKDWWND